MKKITCVHRSADRKKAEDHEGAMMIDDECITFWTVAQYVAALVIIFSTFWILLAAVGGDFDSNERPISSKQGDVLIVRPWEKFK